MPSEAVIIIVVVVLGIIALTVVILCIIFWYLKYKSSKKNFTKNDEKGKFGDLNSDLELNLKVSDVSEDTVEDPKTRSNRNTIQNIGSPQTQKISTQNIIQKYYLVHLH